MSNFTGPRRIGFGEGLPFSTDWKTMVDGREKYQCYLCSREWAEKREMILGRCGGVCERCGLNKVDAVHHKTYERKYTERPEDLIGICSGCHAFTHGKSDCDPIESARKAAEADRKQNRPIALALAESGGWSNENIFICPVLDCGGDYVHIEKVAHQKGNDNYDADWEGKGDLVVISMFCEFGHKWETCFGFHKGKTIVFTRRIEDLEIEYD